MAYGTYYMDVYNIPTLCAEGNVWFRNTTTPTVTERALLDIRRVYNVTHIDHTFVATWDHITLKDNKEVSSHISNLFV